MSVTDRLLYGYTYEQWMDPARLAKRAQDEWDRYFAREEAFELVKPQPHWKGPIDAVIPMDRLDDVRDAVTHFAGGRGFKCENLGDGTIRVTAPGYWGNGF